VVGSAGTVARYGGDEFVLILPAMGLEEAKLLGQEALEVTAEPIAIGTSHVRVGMSIGVVTATTPIPDTELVRAADQAAYRAKKAGKHSMVAVELGVTPPEAPTPQLVELAPSHSHG
jgi:diguanylate cyclase (GGDEF)-like protein